MSWKLFLSTALDLPLVLLAALATWAGVALFKAGAEFFRADARGGAHIGGWILAAIGLVLIAAAMGGAWYYVSSLAILGPLFVLLYFALRGQIAEARYQRTRHHIA